MTISAKRQREMLLRHGDDRIVVIDLPWRPDAPHHPRAVADEASAGPQRPTLSRPELAS